MIVAIVPARGGSKRIKNKNIINICGKPMIHHTIQILKKTKIFDEIIVTTDSSKIQNISKKAGAKILSTVTKNTDYVIVGEKAGSKEKKAIELNLIIFSEKDFIKKIKS